MVPIGETDLQMPRLFHRSHSTNKITQFSAPKRPPFLNQFASSDARIWFGEIPVGSRASSAKRDDKSWINFRSSVKTSTARFKGIP
jgi:hypothetical protein